MKRSNFFSRLSVALSMVLMITLVSSCDLSGFDTLEDDIAVSLDIPGIATTYTFQLLDASTGDDISSTARVVFSGTDVGAIIDPIFFDPVTELEVADGFFTVGLTDQRIPSGESQVQFSVFVEADGYEESMQKVVSDATGDYQVTVSMVAESAPPTGVVTRSQSTGSASSGVTSQIIQVATPPEATTGGSAAISIPASTVLTTTSGTPLQGTLQTQVTYFNNQDAQSMAAFPGGLTNVSAQTQNEGQQSGGFVSGGFVSINITDQNGNRAANLSNSATVTMPVPANTINPETGTQVKAGDVIPVWSLEPSSGEWVQEGTVVFASAAEKGRSEVGTELFAEFETAHFSWFNLDWFEWGQATCGWQEAFRLQISGNDRRRNLQVRALRNGGGWAVSKYIGADNNPIFYNFPRYIADVGFEVLYNNSVVAEGFAAGQICGQTIPVALNFPPEPDLVDVNLSVAVECPADGGGSTIVNPSYPFQMRKVGTQTWNNITLSGGSVSVGGLEYNANYELRGSFLDDGVPQTERRTFTINESTNPGDDITLVSGSRVGDTVNLNYRIQNNQTVCDNI